ncbi:RNA-directed DNA polymerase, eukaryota, reverse transcriptase zinc-binding domain protein [Tanacetum coccineum]
MIGILKKLDRAMSNEEFMKQFPNAHAKFLPYIISDHTPCVLCLPTGIKKKVKAFKISSFITNKKDFLPIEKEAWKEDIEGFHMLVEEFLEAESDEEKFLFQQAKIMWLSEGDMNSSIDTSDNLFHMKLSEENASNMVRYVADDEIKMALFDINDSKALGPDSFTAAFFKKSWCIIGRDICCAIREFFITGKLLGELNATLVSLIPKVPIPNKVADFRPISYCNVLYKCISKVITNRIKPVLGCLVSHNQSAFIQGRHIQDNILLTHEIMKGYNRKNGPQRVPF